MKSTKQASISAPNHLRIGEYHKAFGGALAGIMRGAIGKPDYYLFVAGGDKGEAKALKFGPREVDVSAATSDIDGLANTVALVTHKETHPAAEWAAGLTIDGFKDFYLPARHELRLCYLNTPELFAKEWHWSSTQYAGNSGNAWCQNFGDGNQSDPSKDYEGRCRAVRRFLII